MAKAANQPEPIIGIDLGTTYSVVATLDSAGRPVTVPNRHGELATPSVVLFEDEGVVVGKEAQRFALVEPGRVAECAKRDFGSPYYHRPIAGRQIPPQVISAIVLKRLKTDAELQLGPIRRAVITVPAYFDHTRREATLEAARLAGLEGAALLNEPTAAALAYGFREGFLDSVGALSVLKTARPGVMTVMVYDLGGGTFDVTIVEIRDRTFKTIATDGDSRLGGRDWDRRIVDHAAAQFMAEHQGNDPRTDPVTRQVLFREAEEAKRTLSERSKTRLTYAHNGQQVVLSLPRDEFEELTADLLERTRVTTMLVLKETGLRWSDIDKVILSGGSTRLPQVSRMLRELSGMDPDRSMSPDEAVAHGAAIYRGILYNIRRRHHVPDIPSTRVVNVNAHSLGIITRNRSDNRLINTILIPRNTSLPHTSSQTFKTTKSDQKAVLVQIVEGEAVDPAECTLLGKYLIQPLPSSLPAGSPIRLQYSYDGSGRIKVRAVIDGPTFNTELQVDRRGSIIGQDVEDWAMNLLNRADSD